MANDMMEFRLEQVVVAALIAAVEADDRMRPELAVKCRELSVTATELLATVGEG